MILTSLKMKIIDKNLIKIKMLIVEYLFCCQFTTNDIIIDLFEDLATKRQKCPTITNKIKSYEDNYYKLYLDILSYFKVKETFNNSNNLNIKSWSSIRKKSLKDLILKNYIIEVKQKYNFDATTTNRLKKDLMVGLNFKNINDKNIIISNNKISKILGLSLSTNSYNWSSDILK
jgi:hypothetical protein